MRVFARGVGPGPKNVGIELDDGTRTVVTYRTFIHKYKGACLSDKQYAGASGHVQFDPKHREVNGKQVLDLVIRAHGSQKLIDITIWPEFTLTAEIKKGDFISVDGSYTTRTFQRQDGSTGEGMNVSPTSLVHIPAVARAEREVVQQQGAAAQTQTAPF